MATTKVALSLASKAVRTARRQVARGRAKSLSAFVSDALEEKLCHDELEKVLDAMDTEFGRPSRKAIAWAKRALARSS